MLILHTVYISFDSVNVLSYLVAIDFCLGLSGICRRSHHRLIREGLYKQPCLCYHTLKLNEGGVFTHKRLALIILTSILLLSAISVLGCTGPSANDGKQDLLAPYKNPDGTFIKDAKITDESINRTVMIGMSDWLLFSATHPEITSSIDISGSPDSGIGLNICLYQEDRYRALTINMTGLKDKNTGKPHKYDVCVIVRQDSEKPQAYIGYAMLDGNDLLPSYPASGLYIVPTRLSIPDDKILDK